MSGADIVVQVLADEGVDTIFGYSGGAILPTYDAVFRYNKMHGGDGDRSPMPLIVPANEQGAGFMAAGYARASGKVGVVMVTSGPGATNTVTPVRDCMADSIPIVVICELLGVPVEDVDLFFEWSQDLVRRADVGALDAERKRKGDEAAAGLQEVDRQPERKNGQLVLPVRVL